MDWKISVSDTKWLGREILHLRNTDSTNEEIKRQAEIKNQGFVVVADTQSAGRGRLGRTWESADEGGIWMSFLLKPEISPDKASQITLIAALATALAIRNVTGLPGYIKWPNDIVINRKKIVGILTEMSTGPDKINYVVVGIGINANISSFPDNISDYAGSLMIEGNKPVDRNRIIAELLKKFEEYYEIFLKDSSLAGIMAEYEKLLINKGSEVVLSDGGVPMVRTAVGISDKGELLVKDESGVITTVLAGEVSVRGLYGYV